jgi:AbrB family looped-hinge helix DNA binding protein
MHVTITVDKAGRVVLPKPVRDKLRLNAGDSLELESSAEEIVLRPQRAIARMRKRDGIWVFRTGSAISAASVNEAIEELREERAQAAFPPKAMKQRRSGKSR